MAATRVHPHDAVADRAAVAVDGDGAGPLARDADRHHLLGGYQPASQGPAGGPGDHLPPLLGILHGAAAIQPTSLDRQMVVPRDLAHQ